MKGQTCGVPEDLVEEYPKDYGGWALMVAQTQCGEEAAALGTIEVVELVRRHMRAAYPVRPTDAQGKEKAGLSRVELERTTI